jgi:hypothetical protein
MSKDNTTNKLNNARIACFGGYVPVYDLECVDTKQEIYKGKQITQPEQRKESSPFLFFSRSYKPDINELDQIFKEISFDDKLLGVPFILVPKEKLLFGYQPSPKHGVLLPAVKVYDPRIGGKRRQ